MDSEYVYPFSLNEAVSRGENQLYWESYWLNIHCKNAIEQIFMESSDGLRLKEGCSRDVIARFGHDRVQFVLTSTILHSPNDGRISPENRTWAETYGVIPETAAADCRRDYVVDSLPGMLDAFTSSARREYESLGLFGRTHCCTDTQDYTHKVLAVDPKNLASKYKTPENQLFYAYGGFGCSPSASGRKVMGEFLADGEKTNFYRQDFLGVLRDQYLPEWAREKRNSLNAAGNQPEQETGPKIKL